jgi:hypothetical protein
LGTGLLFALMGLVGALFTTFTLIGGAVPGTAGQAGIEADTARLERMTKRLEELIGSTKLNAAAVKSLGEVVDRLRDDLGRERWRQFAIGAVLYAVLGAFFGAMLGQDILTALAIGAGWTGLVGSLGLKRDYAQRKSEKDDAIGRLVAAVEQPPAAEEVDQVKARAELARAL